MVEESLLIMKEQEFRKNGFQEGNYYYFKMLNRFGGGKGKSR